MSKIITISPDSLNQIIHGMGLVEDKEHYNHGGKIINRVVFKSCGKTYMTYYAKDGGFTDWDSNGYVCRSVKPLKKTVIEYVDD